MAKFTSKRRAAFRNLFSMGALLILPAAALSARRPLEREPLKGTPAEKLVIALKSKSALLDVSRSVSLIETLGYGEVGRGSARYVRDHAIAPEIVKQIPEAVIVAKDGSVFRIAEELPTIYHFGGVGTGYHDDADAWAALCRFAETTGARRVSLAGAIVGARRPFILPAGVSLEARGGQFKALSNFIGETVVSSPENQQYRDLTIDLLDIDVDGQMSSEGRPIGGLCFPWASYVTIDKIFVRNCTGFGVQIRKGVEGAVSGSTHELFCSYISIMAAQNVSKDAVGFSVDGSDHCFQYGVVFGFAVGGASPGSNNFLGTWHVWSRYREGWTQMRLGWDASGEGNRAVLEIDSPGCVDASEPSSLANGPVGVHLHNHAIRNKIEILINVSRWGSASSMPKPKSIIPIFIETGGNRIDLDIVDYLGRVRKNSTISDSRVVYSDEKLAPKNIVSGG
ncbi:hypothetical protein [Sphingomonas sp. Y38-1Y]|uniref:hypothetical protein n=1 Tax=Sphingomonas sp. Y38-1Y TaxID=3078265 RepID=UPI0028ED5F49|nr:hypothetical protein [Sphingomonas sp. Y38-1Y]